MKLNILILSIGLYTIILQSCTSLNSFQGNVFINKHRPADKDRTEITAVYFCDSSNFMIKRGDYVAKGRYIKKRNAIWLNCQKEYKSKKICGFFIWNISKIKFKIKSLPNDTLLIWKKTRKQVPLVFERLNVKKDVHPHDIANCDGCEIIFFNPYGFRFDPENPIEIGE